MPNSDIHYEHLGEDEESYFVSMTDMMVGMLFVFIIMLMSFALNYKHQESNVARDSIVVMQSKQKTDQIIEELTGANRARSRILEELRKSLFSQGVTVAVDDKNGILRLPEHILFPSASAEVKQGGEKALAILAHELEKILPCYTFRNVHDRSVLAGGNSCKTSHRLEAVLIEGHTDNVPLNRGSRFQSNWELSTARAITTYNKLMANAPGLKILLNQNALSVFGVSGYGENRPFADNNDKDKRGLNRRIDLRFLMSGPRPDELNALEDKVRHAP